MKLPQIAPFLNHESGGDNEPASAYWDVSLLAAFGYLAQPVPALSQTAQGPGAKRDGQHDFDFEIGTWKIHLSRLQDRLADSTTWVKFDGTSVTRKVWDGRANLEEFETDSPTGHIEGLTLRVYNPQTHQWSIYWANSKDPASVSPFNRWSASSRMVAANFTIRNYGREDLSLFDLCGRTSL